MKNKTAELKNTIRGRHQAWLRSSSPQKTVSDGEAAATGVIDEVNPHRLAERILVEIRHGSCRPHHKILSQRRLATRFGVSQGTIFKAIALLQKKGYVYTRGCSGVYLTEQAASVAIPVMRENPIPDDQAIRRLHRDSVILPYIPAVKTLRIAVPVYDDPIQVRMWTRVFDAFHHEFPFVRLELDFSSKPGPDGDQDDVEFISPIKLGTQPDTFLPLAPTIMEKAGFRPDRLPAGLLDIGRRQTNGQLLGLPLLRTTTMLAANRAVLAGSSYAACNFRTPAELFQAGQELNGRDDTQVQGLVLPSCYHGAALYGVTVTETTPGHYTFNRDRMSAFLTDLRPESCTGALLDCAETSFSRFVEKRLGFYFYYWTIYPELRDAVPELEPLPIPLNPGGFVCESMFLGTIPRNSRHGEEAMLLLGYLSSAPAQALLVEENPHWFSIDHEVLERQRRESPFPPGAVHYEFDPRCYYTHMNPNLYYEYWPRIGTEVMKYLLGLQDQEAVLGKMERTEKR